MSEQDARKIIDGINRSKEAIFNQDVQLQLRNLKLETTRIYDEMSRLPTASPLLEDRLRLQKERNVAALCQILREHGWVSRALVGAEGGEIAAAIFLDNPPQNFQQQLIPVMEAAFKAGEISKSNWAKIIDHSRVRTGKKQVFGTLVGISKDLLLLYPIENEAKVDDLRREYELPPLSEQIRRLERKYQAVVIKAPRYEQSPLATEEGETGATAQTSKNTDEEVLQVETNLVNLNVTVLPEKAGAPLPPLGKNDFIVSENGSEQTIEYFAAAQIPFDITLLIDISGSTSNKNKLIRKTTRNFINAARPADRISIATFDETVSVVSPLTQEREKLLASVEKIKSGGGSKVWDALDWWLEQSAESENYNSPNKEPRRRAVVFITDGADNGFVNDRDASSTTFAELLEKLRRSSALVVPIHLDTREDYAMGEKLYRGTRRALTLLADETGGLFYQARKIDDLTDVYGQVVNDLSKVYSIGYSPANTNRDGLWRAVKINLKNNSNLIVRSRKGYYAR